MRGAIAYVQAVTGVDNDSFHKKGYRDCLTWLSTITARSQAAIEAKEASVEFALFTGFQMEDDWVHVRYLLAALRNELQNHGGAKAAKDLDLAEQHLTCVFAIIRAGADDPLPWLLVLDGILRNVWRAMSGKGLKPSAFQLRLFNELATWCNGTGIQAFFVRVPRTTVSRDDVLVSEVPFFWLRTSFEFTDMLTLLQSTWYKLLYDYDPTCANDDCMRLLTHPDLMTSKKFRAVMSVGTRETRVGLRSVRAFISTNRREAYPCLYDVVRVCKCVCPSRLPCAR